MPPRLRPTRWHPAVPRRSVTGYVNKPVSLPIQATGGTRPYRWTADGLPAGLSLDTATGTVTGAPTTWGMRTSRITLTDAAGRTATTDITWNVYF
ncbi:Ig domain-containing protein [Streptomyces sp. NPDC051577]|uniref:Ig domain-containing protein n=1 Tax=Streptomyces sp. NPDC051577 TaxID=3155166 RepID=UPI003427ECAD